MGFDELLELFSFITEEPLGHLGRVFYKKRSAQFVEHELEKYFHIHVFFFCLRKSVDARFGIFFEEGEQKLIDKRAFRRARDGLDLCPFDLFVFRISHYLLEKSERIAERAVAKKGDEFG